VAIAQVLAGIKNRWPINKIYGIKCGERLMSKADRKRELIISIAKEPWQHSIGSLAQALCVDEITISRDLKQLSDSGFLFDQNELSKLFLLRSGCPQHEPVKDPVIRQMEIMRFISSDKKGKNHSDIISWFKSNSEIDVSDRTVERTINELRHKKLVVREGERYKSNPEKVITQLYLEEKERTILLEALAVAEGSAPLPEEVKSVSALLKKLVSKGEPTKWKTVHVHGRSPVHDLTVNYLCRKLESAARSRNKLRVLYRKSEEPASERTINPRGLVYYWVLDKWYVVAVDGTQTEQVKTYAVDNILFCEETGETFEPQEGFELQDYFRCAWGIYRGDDTRAVKVRFDNYYTVIQRVKEELSHRDTCVFTEAEDGLIMTDTVQGLEEFAVWLRSFGPSVEVIEPAELREKVVEELRKTLANYEGVEL
jgi:predicted DNA-binding transcriptional regulator YafY